MEDKIGKTLADNIRAERSRKNLSQEEVSEQLGMTRRTYIKYENDASKIPSSMLAKLAEIFGCDIKSFFINM